MSFFTDIVEKDPRFTSSQRIHDLVLLEPVTMAAVQKIVKYSRVLGFDMMVFETFRSTARQQQRDKAADSVRT